MASTPLNRPRLHNRLGFRIGIFVAVCIVIGDQLFGPLYDYLIPPPSISPESGDIAPWGDGNTLILFGLSTLYASVIGSILGWVASRYSLPRLRAIASQAEGTMNDELPGEFDERGHDEITQVARALNRMRDRISGLVGRLADRDDKRNEWVAQVSHDLRTPLTALITSLEHTSSLLEHPPSTMKRLQANNLEALADAKRVTALAEDLLDIASLEIEGTVQREPVLPGEIIYQAKQSLAPLARRGEIKITTHVEASLPALEADGRLIVRAIENLTSNAIRHAASWVKLSASFADELIHFVVEDDGPGLTEVDGVATFADMRRNRSGPDSVGLGLMVIERVASAHGGSVGAENRPEGGAKIWFTLPVV
jgi:signal transduction histidine kinase